MHIREGNPVHLPQPPRDAFVPRPASSDLPGDVYVPENGRAAPQRPDAPPTVGAQRPFWIWDFTVMPPAPRQIATTLRAVGDHGCVWVDDAAWGKSVSASDVAVLDQRFNRGSQPGSVDPTHGIFDVDASYFGDLPHGIDPDSRANLVVTDMAAFQGTTLDGYFNAFDQLPDTEAWQKYQQHSNEKNIIYLNSSGGKVASDYMLGVLAHEFSHLLQFNKGGDPPAWWGETLAEVAMVVNGYHTDIHQVERHLAKPSSPLVREDFTDYGAAYLFGTYLQERYGKTFINEVVRSPESGIPALESTLKSAGSSDTFASIFDDWVVANYADSQAVIAPGFHYATLDLPAPAEAHVLNATSKVDGTLKPTGVAYERFDLAGDGKVKLTGDAPCSVQLMSFHDGRMTVQHVDPSQPLTVPKNGVLAIAATGNAPLHYTLEVFQDIHTSPQ